jgi:hypothetical protein
MSVKLFPEATQEQRLMAESAIRIMEASCPLQAVPPSRSECPPLVGEGELSHGRIS